MRLRGLARYGGRRCLGRGELGRGEWWDRATAGRRNAASPCTDDTRLSARPHSPYGRRPPCELIPLVPERCILVASRPVAPRVRPRASRSSLDIEGTSGSTDRDGMSKCCPGSEWLAAMRALASRRGPRNPCRARGRNFPESLVGPPTAAKIRRSRAAGRPCRMPIQRVPGGYAALRLELTQNLERAALRGKDS